MTSLIILLVFMVLGVGLVYRFATNLPANPQPTPEPTPVPVEVTPEPTPVPVVEVTPEPTPVPVEEPPAVAYPGAEEPEVGELVWEEPVAPKKKKVAKKKKKGK